MRIISGIYGGRKLDTPKTGDIRPTSDKIRGAIFNALQSRMDLDGARVLDICCGTGALGLESISRGAAHCTFFDKSKKSLELAQQNAKALGAQNCCTFLNQPIENIKKMQPNFAAADLFFADPPYHLNLLQKLLETLPATGWIKAGSLGIVECEKNLALPAPQHFEIVNEKIYGETKIIFLNHRPATEY